jgi:hypothetical protein
MQEPGGRGCLCRLIAASFESRRPEARGRRPGARGSDALTLGVRALLRRRRALTPWRNAVSPSKNANAALGNPPFQRRRRADARLPRAPETGAGPPQAQPHAPRGWKMHGSRAATRGCPTSLRSSSGSDALVLGSNALVLGSNALVLGSNALLTGSNALVLGSNALVLGSNALLTGVDSREPPLRSPRAREGRSRPESFECRRR